MCHKSKLFLTCKFLTFFAAHEKFDILYRREEIGDRSPKEFMLYLKNKYKRAGHNVTAGDLRQAYASGISQEFQQVFFDS